MSISKFQSDLDNFKKLHKLVEKHYVKGQPRYISDPHTSYIRVLTYDEYKALSVNAVQSLIRNYHLVITGFPIEQIVDTDHVNFDESGLQLLKNIEAPIEFQGKSPQSLPLNSYCLIFLTLAYRPIDPSD